MNFIGPNDEFVVSGSDDGNFFIWDKHSATIHGIYEGDGTVVNVIEGHPQIPLLAVSGIDYSVKVLLRHSVTNIKYGIKTDWTLLHSSSHRRRQSKIITHALLKRTALLS